MSDDAIRVITPQAVLKKIVEAIPPGYRKNIIILGSLAAAYHFSAGGTLRAIRTKDVDCLIAPRIEAVSAGEHVANQLIDFGWELRVEGDFGKPGTEITPDDKLPAVRLYPPGEREWFIELLTVPEKSEERNRRFLRITTKIGDFGLPSFGFLSLVEFEPVETEFGVQIARPEMMALANLLEHPEIKAETMSGLIAGRKLKRSNKDLGRVLALARLSGESTETWPQRWVDALQYYFRDEWRSLALCAGRGLRELIGSPGDLEQAVYSCNNGLLVGSPVNPEQLEATGRRLIQDVVEPVEQMAA